MDNPVNSTLMNAADAANGGSASSSAAHVIAGFRYQILQSIVSLIGLRDSEELLLEVFEDFTIASETTVTDVQVKNSQAAKGPRPFSLRSSEISSVLERFWEASNHGSLDRRLVFLARGGAAAERNYQFPGDLAGLVYWRAAAMDADTQPLRAALIDILPDSSLKRWLVTEPHDSELRSRLLRRVQWELDSRSADQLALQLRDEIGELLYARNLPMMAGAQVLRTLVDLAFETAAKPTASERRLTRRHLVQVMDEAAAVVLVGQKIATPALSSDVGQNILVHELDEIPSFLSQRTATVDQLVLRTIGQPLIWIHGANGVGKSTLARLVASRLGGRWLALDLRPVQRDAAGSLAAWRELARAIALNETADGIIIDDFDHQGAIALRSRLPALSQMLGSRGGRVIVTSHHEPSSAVLFESGSSAATSIQAPYFSEDDISDLVGANPAPEQEMIRPWSIFISLTTGGGHPLLAAAKLSSLRARGWPTAALVEDVIGGPSEAVRLSRESARRTLLRDLAALDQARSLDAGQLLRRIGSVFDRVDDGLIRQLAVATPALPNGGDALAILRGTWLEQVPGGDLRVSPLLADIASDVPLPHAQDWRRLAAEYWLAKRTLDARTLPLCFWNAFWGDHSDVLMVLCNTIQTMPKERLRAAAALLSPMTVLATDKPLYSSNLAVAVQLRLLQFEVADAMEEGELAGKIAHRLIAEIATLGHPDLIALTTHISMSKFLMAEFAEFSPADRISFALALRAVEPKVRGLADDVLPDPASILPPQFKPSMDVADLLFSTMTTRIKNSSDEYETFVALDVISPRDRNNFLDAMSLIFEGHSVFVHSGWSRDQIEERDMSAALTRYDQIAVIAGKWNRPDLELEIACARSIILDEGLKRYEDAIGIIDEAILRFGAAPALLRQKSKVFGHAGRDTEAVVLVLQIEDEIGLQSPFDRSLALRDGALSAARSSQFDDAIRMIDKARSSLSSVDGRLPWSSGLLIERSLMLWRASRQSEALSTAADALEAVERFLPTESRQAERSHQYARAIVGLFFAEVDDGDRGEKPPFTFGDASALESDTAQLLRVDLKPLADNWRVLATVEASMAVDVGIYDRSMSKQGGLLIGTTELLLLKIRYEWAVRSRDISRSLIAGAAVVSAANVLKEVPRGTDGLQRFDATRLIATAPKILATDISTRGMLQSLVLDAIIYRAIVASEPLNRQFLDGLQQASNTIFGESSDISTIIRTASGEIPVGPTSSMSAIYAYAAGISEQSIRGDPALRFYRDLMITGQIATSLGRGALAPAFVRKIADGWQYVLDRQRFRLSNLAHHLPAIESALQEMKSPTLEKTAALLLAAAPAVGHKYGEGWQELLMKIASKTST